MTGIIHQSLWLLRDDKFAPYSGAQYNKTLQLGKQLALGLQIIESDTGSLPKKLEDIDLDEIEMDREDFIKITHPYGNRWLYFGDQVTSRSSEEILLLYPFPSGTKQKRWIIIYADGSGEISPNDTSPSSLAST